MSQQSETGHCVIRDVPKNSMLYMTTVKYGDKVPSICKKLIEDTIGKIPTTGGGLKHLNVDMGKIAFILQGSYDKQTQSINMVLNSNMKLSGLASQEYARSLIRHEAMHHVWISRTSVQEVKWSHGIDVLLEKIHRAPTKYVQKFVDAKNGESAGAEIAYFNKDGKAYTYADFVEQNKDVIYNESHSEVSAYIHEGNIHAYDYVVDGKRIIDWYVDLYIDVFGDEKDLKTID